VRGRRHRRLIDGGQQMKVIDDSGRILDAEVSLSVEDGRTAIVIESRGPDRNTDYIPAFELLLKRLAENSAELLSVELATRLVEKPLGVPRRRFPIQLQASDDTGALATALRNAAAAAGREPGARGKGNATKRLRIRFRLAGGSDLKDNELIERIVGSGASKDATTGTTRTAARASRVTPRERRRTTPRATSSATGSPRWASR